MTPLKPIENRRVRGVASTRYPLNTVCAHPECTEPAADPHHCFPRSQIIGDSWFVEMTLPRPEEEVAETGGPPNYISDPIPHVTGLCRAHHEDVEAHRAWIKLEDGEFRWYDRNANLHFENDGEVEWELLGPLNPQPGSREGKPKRKKYLGEKKRNRVTWTIRVPKDARENGVEILKNLVEQGADKLGIPEVPPYFVLVAALYHFISSEEAV